MLSDATHVSAVRGEGQTSNLPAYTLTSSLHPHGSSPCSYPSSPFTCSSDVAAPDADNPTSASIAATTSAPRPFAAPNAVPRWPRCKRNAIPDESLADCGIISHMIALKAHYDGKVLVPDEPVSLATNQKVLLQIQPIDSEPPTIDNKPKRTFLVQPGVITYVAPDFDAHLGDDFWGIEDSEAKK